ncbi:MAG TPA: ABC transporter permease [Longimicrobiales bacterium]|nr:ABC transporter permease [Longimicrobiales bacterium]
MSLLSRFREFLDARREHDAVAEEMQFHIERETQRNVANGMSPTEARRAAMRDFGGVDRFREHARDERPGTRLADLRASWLDWKLGGRMLLKYPGLSIIGGITLAAAIALSVGIFEFSWEMRDPRLPLPGGERIVRLENLDVAESTIERRSVHDFLVWRDELESIEQLGAYRAIERNLITPDGRSEPVDVAEISPVAFPLTRVPPLLGRPLVEADAAPGAQNVVVIGYELWRSRFGEDPSVVGSTVQLSRAPATVVGVMPEGYSFPINHQIWTPLRLEAAQPREGLPIRMFGRLRDGVSLTTAQAELASVGARMARANPATHEHLRPRVLRYAAPSATLGADADDLIVANLLVWVVLLIAGTNVATLMFARTALRESEIVVRNALGASRGRVMAQLFVESLVLSLVAAAVGVALAMGFMKYARENFASDVDWPFWWDLSLSLPTVLYTTLVAVGIAAIVGLLPAIHATGPRVQAALRSIGGGGTHMQIGRVWSALIVFQVALSVLGLPVAIALTGEQLAQQQARDMFDARPFLTFRPQLDADEVTGDDPDLPARMATLVGELERRLEADGDVVAVTFADALPAVDWPPMQVELQRGTESPVIVDTKQADDQVVVSAVDADFFEAFGAPITAGRSFHSGDIGSDHGVAIINESLAQRIGGNPIGVRLRTVANGEDPEAKPWLEVVGVVGDVGLESTAEGEAELIYTPASVATLPAPPHMVVRVRGDAAAFEWTLRETAARVAPDLRLYEVMTLEEVIRLDAFDGVLMTASILVPVLLVLLLSAAALFALMSVAVARRTREIGIRLAIGASPRALLAALFKRAALQIGVGIVAGNLLVLALMSVIENEFDAVPTALPMLAASLIMVIVGLAACFVPARRALAVQPTEAVVSAQ